jgi:hypothetical protein
MIFAIIGICIVILIITFFILFINKNKQIKNYLYKINVGEEEIIKNLKIKLNIMSEICTIQTDITKIESNLFAKIKSEKEDDIKSFACISALDEAYDEILSIDEDYDVVLKNNDKYLTLFKDLNEVNTKLTCLGTFYNKYAIQYNNDLDNLLGKILKKKNKYNIKKLYVGDTLEEEVNLN